MITRDASAARRMDRPAFLAVHPYWRLLHGARRRSARMYIPARLRLVLAGAVAFLVAPLIPQPTGIVLFSLSGILVTIQQVIIGVAIGFAMNVLFDARLDGRPVAREQRWDCPTRSTVDPVRGSGTPVLRPALRHSRDAHVPRARRAPRAHRSAGGRLPHAADRHDGTPNRQASGRSWPGAPADLLAGALAVALPGIAALLVVNIAFGVMSRARRRSTCSPSVSRSRSCSGWSSSWSDCRRCGPRSSSCSARHSCWCARSRAEEPDAMARQRREKNQQPTPEALGRSAEKGQIPRSQELERGGGGPGGWRCPALSRHQHRRRHRST